MAAKLVTNYLPELSKSIFGRSKPSNVAVNLTSKCNQHCIYCEIGKGIPTVKKYRLTTDDLKWIVDQMAEIKMPKISLCGGEPFLFDGIFDVVAYAGIKNVRCNITTNGMTVNKLTEHDLYILKECKTEINISIDSFQDTIQSFTRGTPSALKNAIKSAQRLQEKDIPVNVLAAISKYNYHDLYNFFLTAHDMRIKQVLFQPIIYYSNYPDRNTIPEKEQLNVSVDKLDVLMDELNKILQFEKKHDINTNVYRIKPWIEHYIRSAADKNGGWFFDKVLEEFYCRDLYAIIDITYDGGIQPCGLAAAEINIHENRHLGLEALWLKATEQIREDLSKGLYRPYCNGCCHHFSRNMIASIFRHPLKNRVALINILPLLLSRVYFRTLKKLLLHKP